MVGACTQLERCSVCPPHFLPVKGHERPRHSQSTATQPPSPSTHAHIYLRWRYVSTRATWRAVSNLGSQLNTEPSLMNYSQIADFVEQPAA